MNALLITIYVLLEKIGENLVPIRYDFFEKYTGSNVDKDPFLGTSAVQYYIDIPIYHNHDKSILSCKKWSESH